MKGLGLEKHMEARSGVYQELARGFGDYFKTHIERDLRQLVNVKNVNLFQRFVILCAGRTGQLLNLSNLANDTGISHSTAREWITVLQASYIVYLLPPFYRNIKKRLVKSPKLYFYDVGLACWLYGIEHEHNEKWTHHTRPFVEAFFHAKYFLEMVIKYGKEIEEPPEILPSGWAAVLCYVESLGTQEWVSLF